MPTVQIPFSQSTDGRAIRVSSGSFVLIHTSTNVVGGFDQIFLYVTNPGGTTNTMQLGWGAQTPLDDRIFQQAIAAGADLQQVLSGLILRNGQIIQVVGSVAVAADPLTAGLYITGYVLRTTP